MCVEKRSICHTFVTIVSLQACSVWGVDAYSMEGGVPVSFYVGNTKKHK